MNVRSVGFEALVCGVVGVLSAGCSEQTKLGEKIERIEQRVELHDLNDVYGFSFVPAPALGTGEAISRLRERLEKQTFPVHATGAVHVPLRDAFGNPVSQFGVPIRFTCGATLISPSYLITAAHCVDSESVRDQNDLVTLEMYRPTERLAHEEIWRPRTELSGTFPSYQRLAFSEAEGYFTDRYSCRVQARCGFGALNCPNSSISTQGDVAILLCDGRPGDRYGYVDVAASESPAGSEVFAPWKHEIYDIPPSEPATADRYLHYVRYPSSSNYWDNYHYHGGDRNQLLPVHSVSWPNGTPRRKLGSTSGLVVWTDVLACHGTSGSGFMQRDAASGAWQLLGPTALGSGNLAGFLCQHNPGMVGQGNVSPGQNAIGYASVLQTQTIASPYASAMRAECPRPQGGRFFLPARTNCERSSTGLNYQERTAYGDLEPWRSPSARLGAGVSNVGTLAVTAGRSYRLSLGAVATGSCTEPAPGARLCPEISVRVGVREVLRRTFESFGQAESVGALFEADATGAQVVSIAVARGQFEVGELTLTDSEGRANSFDDAADRGEVGLVLPGQDPAAVLPMRFVGDGGSGFAALLEPGERLLLSRQAIALRGAWSLRFSATPVVVMRCGFVARDGSVLASQPCTADSDNIVEYTGSEPPAAVFFESDAPGSPVRLDDVRVDLLDLAEPPLCQDEAKNGDESDVDCGGSCPRCADGKLCTTSADCVSGLCQSGVCAAAPRCDDGAKNGSETDVDCGGPTCGDCANGRACQAAGDCVSGLCQSGVCVAAPRCDDGAKNGSETDVDCGGPTCGDCANGRACQAAGDCVSGLCQSGVCVARPTTAVTATLLLESNWDQGYCAKITITNVSAAVTNGWTAVFNVNQSTVKSSWSAEFSRNGSVYTARALSWNARLDPNQNTTFGFCADKTGTNWRPTITSATSP